MEALRRQDGCKLGLRDPGLFAFLLEPHHSPTELFPSSSGQTLDTRNLYLKGNPRALRLQAPPRGAGWQLVEGSLRLPCHSQRDTPPPPKIFLQHESSPLSYLPPSVPKLLYHAGAHWRPLGDFSRPPHTAAAVPSVPGAPQVRLGRKAAFAHCSQRLTLVTRSAMASSSPGSSRTPQP